MMARFFVGQRVRIKWSVNWPELANAEGTIVRKSRRRFFDHPACEWDVAPDLWGTSIAPQPGMDGATEFSPNSDQLEPITDSYDVTSWDTCVWKPEHLRVGA